MYKNIVVGTDGSTTASLAVEAATELARDFGAKLQIVSAYSQAASGMAAASGFALADGNAVVIAHDTAEQVAADAKAKFGSGLDVETHAIPRHPADAIIEVAEGTGADLIVVGSKGMTGARRILGSIPNSVAHSAPCAVLIVKTA